MINQKSKIPPSHQSFSGTQKNQKSKTSGFVALFTVLIAGIILAMAIGIANVTYKELVLSSEARDANIAFFAADTGAECALYWDLSVNMFDNNLTPSISCVGEIPSISAVYPIYKFEIAPTLDTCAVVTVDKNFSENGISYTRITSRGFTAQCSGSGLFDPVLSPKSIERLVSATYPNPVVVVPGGGGNPGNQLCPSPDPITGLCP